MKNLTILMLASLALGISAGTSYAAPAPDTPKQDPGGGSAASQAKRVAAELFEPGLGGTIAREQTPTGFLVVFTHDHHRYTVCTTRDCLSFYTRAEEPRGGLEIVFDRGVDGIADSGSAPRNGNGGFDGTPARKSFAVGEANRPFWQQRYEAALAAACAFLDEQKRS